MMRTYLSGIGLGLALLSAGCPLAPCPAGEATFQPLTSGRFVGTTPNGAEVLPELDIPLDAPITIETVLDEKTAVLSWTNAAEDPVSMTVAIGPIETFDGYY